MTPSIHSVGSLLRRLASRSLVLATTVWLGTTPVWAGTPCITPTTTSFAVVEGTLVDVDYLFSAMGSSVPPAPEDITWQSSSPHGNFFFSNGNLTLTNFGVAWTETSPGSMSWELGDSEKVYVGVSSATGPYSGSVQAQNSGCLITPTPVTINVQLLSNAQATMSSSGTATPGATVYAQVHATHQVGASVLDAVNVPFTFNISGPGSFGIPAPFTVVTNSVGIASIPVNISNSATAGQSITVSASAPGYGSPTTMFTVVGGSNVTSVTGGVDPMSPGQTGPDYVVTVMDPYGYPISTFSGSVQITQGSALVENGGAPALSIPLTSNPMTGEARFRIVAGTAPGPVAAKIAISGAADVFVYTSVNAPAAFVVTNGDNQQLLPGQLSEPIGFRIDGLLIRSPAGSAPSTAQVSILSGDAVIAESGGSTAMITLNATLPPTGQFSIVAGNTPGPVEIGIASAGTAPTITPATAYAEILNPVPLQPLAIAGGDGQVREVGTVLPIPLAVRVPPDPVAAAALGKTASAIQFNVISGQARFSANGQSSIVTPVDATSGIAQAELRLLYEIGQVRIQASAPGYLPVVFTANAVAPGQVLELTRLSAPPLGAAGTLSDPMVVQLTRSGVPVASARIDWQLISGNATLTASDSQTDANGRSSNTLTFGTFAGDIVVRATHTPVDGTFSVSTDFTLGAPAQGALLSVSAGNGQSGPIGGTLDQPIEFWLHNHSGPIAGEIVNFSVAGAATLTATSATTDSEGKVRANLRFGGTAGAVTVTARAFANQISASAVATSFVPNLAIVSGDGQSAAASAALPDPLVIGISQPAAALLGKALGGLAVNWRVLCGNGTLTAASTQTDSFGHSQNRLTLGPSPGCNQVEAAIQGVGTVTFNATATVPSGTILEIVSGNGQALVPLADSAPLRVRARTPDGQNLAGIVIAFSADRSEATLDPTEATTAADGTASTIARIGLPLGVRVSARIRDASAVAAVEFALNAGVVNTANLGAAETGVAIAIDSACPRLAGMNNLTAGQADLLARCSELVGNAANHPSEVNRALGEMLGDEASSQNSAALAAATSQLDHLKSRFAALRSGSRGLDLAGLNLMVPGGAIPLSLLPSAIALAVGETPEEVGAEFSRWGFFATGTIGRGERDPDTLDPGYKYDSYDVTAGVDYRATDSWVLGAALGFNGNDTRLPNARGGMDATGWTVSGYASWFSGSQWYVDGVLSYGSNQFDLERGIDYSIGALAGGLTRVDQIALASPDGDRQSFSLSLGRDFNKGAWSFGPYLRAAYTSIDFDSYSETMSNPSAAGSGLALQVDGRTLKSLQGVVGGKLSYAISTSWGVLLPSAQIEWVNEFEDDPELLVTRFLHDPTQTPILIESDRIDDNYFNIGLGLSGVFASGRSAYLYYEHVAGQERMSSDSLAIGIRIEF
ncbi:MAG: autotransporter outer membrane beta-barrel domain-containing protein [Xanthomonadales bacterium]|nr:autotransporter outer membrane beta-barrel domain-containing protein [Xanthomonadales bacterium]